MKNWILEWCIGYGNEYLQVSSVLLRGMGISTVVLQTSQLGHHCPLANLVIKLLQDRGSQTQTTSGQVVSNPDYFRAGVSNPDRHYTSAPTAQAYSSHSSPPLPGPYLFVPH